MSDESDLEKRLRRAKLDPKKDTRWTDYLAAGFQPAEKRNEYITQRAAERKRQEEAEAAERKKKSGPGV